MTTYNCIICDGEFDNYDEWEMSDDGVCVICSEMDEEEQQKIRRIIHGDNEQAAPVKNDSKPIWEMVIEDMRERDNLGRKRYGTPLQANNGRDALRDAYEEVLDLAVYLKQEIEERKIMRIITESLVPSISEAERFKNFDHIKDEHKFGDTINFELPKREQK